MNQSFQKRKFSAPSTLCSVCNACMNVTSVRRLRELCVKLMFLHPVDYGRKAEELLWRKVYYEVIQVIKTNKKVRVPASLRGNSVHSAFFLKNKNQRKKAHLPLSTVAHPQPQRPRVRLPHTLDRWRGFLSAPAALHPVTLPAGAAGLYRLDPRHRPADW